MSDTHERPTLSRNVEQEHPYAGLERHSNAKVWVGSLGLAVNLLLLWILFDATLVAFPVVPLVGVIFALVASLSSLWLLKLAFEELRGTRSLPQSRRHRSIRGSRQESVEKSAGRQLLEVIEANGEITPARAALQTSPTVEEAEQLLSELAQKGHLDVRVEGSKLVYAL